MKTINDNIKSILAILIVFLVFAYFFSILWIERKADPQVIIAMVSLATGVMGYYYGSTTSSTKKDETIATLSSSQAPTVGTSEKTTVINQKQNGTDQSTTTNE